MAQFILNNGQDIQVQEFYEFFGFKTRAFAEESFKKAVNSALENSEDIELKSFLKEEYIDSNFIVSILFLFREIVADSNYRC
jgi:hypothetical protein